MTTIFFYFFLVLVLLSAHVKRFSVSCMQDFCHCHCESWEGLFLQGEAALQKHSFREAEPQPVFRQNAKKNYEMTPMQLRPDTNKSLTSTDLCLPGNAWQCSDAYYPETVKLYLGDSM